MNTLLADYIDEFLCSAEFSLIHESAKEAAPQVLATICQHLDKHDVASISIEVLERALHSVLRLGFGPAVVRDAPALLTAYFDFLSNTGRFPPALGWSHDIPLLMPAYQKKIRDDGSIRGETFKKQYTDVSRNDPCPCGSGKKFKKCCLSLMA